MNPLGKLVREGFSAFIEVEQSCADAVCLGFDGFVGFAPVDELLGMMIRGIGVQPLIITASDLFVAGFDIAVEKVEGIHAISGSLAEEGSFILVCDVFWWRAVLYFAGSGLGSGVSWPRGAQSR